MDVTKKDSIKAGVTRISQTEGKLHILVNKYDIYFPYFILTHHD
jgi:hypothetical protein